MMDKCNKYVDGTPHMLKKNGAIEFYRFLFSCIIFVLHFRGKGYGELKSNIGAFSGGYLATEFFFIVSGAFLMQKMEYVVSEEQPEVEAVKYLASKYKRIFPMYYCALILKIIANMMLLDKFGLKTQILKNFPDFLLLQAFWKPSTLNGHWWFISAMIWASFLAYYLIKKKGKAFVYIYAPLMFLFYFGIIYENVGHLDINNNNVFLFDGLSRAFVEISFGCVVYSVYKYLNANLHVSKLFMTILEMGLLSIIITVMYRTRRDYKDFVITLLIGVFVLVSLLMRGALSQLLDNRMSLFLGKISLGIYVNQNTFQQFAKVYFPGRPFWIMAAVTLMATIACSIFVTFILEWVLRRLSKREKF